MLKTTRRGCLTCSRERNKTATLLAHLHDVVAQLKVPARSFQPPSSCIFGRETSSQWANFYKIDNAYTPSTVMVSSPHCNDSARNVLGLRLLDCLRHFVPSSHKRCSGSLVSLHEETHV